MADWFWNINQKYLICTGSWHAFSTVAGSVFITKMFDYWVQSAKMGLKDVYTDLNNLFGCCHYNTII